MYETLKSTSLNQNIHFNTNKSQGNKAYDSQNLILLHHFNYY